VSRSIPSGYPRSHTEPEGTRMVTNALSHWLPRAPNGLLQRNRSRQMPLPIHTPRDAGFRAGFTPDGRAGAHSEGEQRRSTKPHFTLRNRTFDRKLQRLCIKIGVCPDQSCDSEGAQKKPNWGSALCGDAWRGSVCPHCGRGKAAIYAASTLRTSLITCCSDSFGSAPAAICGLSSIGMNRIDGMLWMPKAMANSCSLSVSTL